MGLKAAALLLALLVVVAVPGPVRATSDDTLADARAVVMIGVHTPYATPSTLRHLAEGGTSVVLFGGAIRDRAALIRLTQELYCPARGPLLVAVDQEAGRVGRLTGLVTPLGDPATVTSDDLLEASAMLGADLARLGVNLDLAPVADVVVGPNPALSGRAFGSDTGRVAEMTGSMVRGLMSASVGATVKHFPGHGRTSTDPHTSVARVSTPLDLLLADDLPPFVAGIAAGARFVMVGHPIYEAIDPVTPASLSPAVYDLLRSDLGFDGVAVTDALGMAAIQLTFSTAEAAVAAIGAGADLVIVEDPLAADAVVVGLRAAVAEGVLPAARLTEAADRVRVETSRLIRPGCLGRRPLMPSSPGLPRR